MQVTFKSSNVYAEKNPFLDIQNYKTTFNGFTTKPNQEEVNNINEYNKASRKSVFNAAKELFTYGALAVGFGFLSHQITKIANPEALRKTSFNTVSAFFHFIAGTFVGMFSYMLKSNDKIK